MSFDETCCGIVTGQSQDDEIVFQMRKREGEDV
jgi:hypothetical protein